MKRSLCGARTEKTNRESEQGTENRPLFVFGLLLSAACLLKEVFEQLRRDRTDPVVDDLSFPV